MNTSTKPTCGLYWFRNDCRLADMPALKMLTEQVDHLLCVYVIDPEWFNENQWGYVHMGEHRWQFICQGILDLAKSIAALGNQLVVIEGNPKTAIAELIKRYEVSVLGVADHSGPYEKADVAHIQNHSPELSIIYNTANTLYEDTDFPFSIESMPDTFSPFRRKVEKYAESQSSISTVDYLPPNPSDLPTSMPGMVTRTQLESAKNKESRLFGGETAALAQMQSYFFATDGIAQYKETRNGMLGWSYSSKFSPWLAAGHISPRTILAALTDYENQRVKNDSTYWLFFELLWREFFYWQLHKHGAGLFAYTGIQNKRPGTGLDKAKLHAWQTGQTGYDIVDACMRELNATGFMSNRGRQLVASCFVHELGLDWRYGAAYFEQQLIDFDVGSNYGNWQYLAGVGSDPRGHRQFNLVKQTEQYDGHGRFRQAWLT